MICAISTLMVFSENFHNEASFTTLCVVLIFRTGDIAFHADFIVEFYVHNALTMIGAPEGAPMSRTSGSGGVMIGIGARGGVDIVLVTASSQ